METQEIEARNTLNEPPAPSGKIKSKLYREFLNGGLMQLLTEHHIRAAMENISGRHKKEARALIIIAYLTGARPNEYLRLTAGSIKREGPYIVVMMPGSKGGHGRVMYLQGQSIMAQELCDFASSIYPTMPLFFHYRTKSVRTVQGKKGPKQVTTVSDGLRYWFRKWFRGVMDDDIPPYYLRHNRFSRMSMLGADAEDIRLAKGAKKLDSVFPYLHMSKKRAAKNAKYLT